MEANALRNFKPFGHIYIDNSSFLFLKAKNDKENVQLGIGKKNTNIIKYCFYYFYFWSEYNRVF